MEAAKVTEYLEDYKRCVIIIMDEMHIKEDLVLEKYTGRLVGFTNVGKVNHLLQQFERSLESDQDSTFPIAKSMLVFYVRGLFNDLEFTYAQFACSHFLVICSSIHSGRPCIDWREWVSKSLPPLQMETYKIENFFGCTHSHQIIMSTSH